MKVFIGGSKTIGTIPKRVLKVINICCYKKIDYLIGDCYGIDLAFQNYLKELNYKKVTVYTALDNARNNLGHWQEKAVITNQNGYTANFEKDKLMIKECDFAILVWDNITKGTKNNINLLIHSGKKVIVYDSKGNIYESNKW